MSLFASNSGGGAAAANNYLVSFKAGKCTRADDSNMVTAQKQKGLVFVEKDQQGLTIFVFMNRETNTRTDEIYVFPGEATFKKCKSAGDGRVYLLKVANRREFFWMQDKDDSKDEENATKLNDVLAGKTAEPAGAASPGAGMAGGGNPLGLEEGDLMALNALEPAEREQMLAMLGLTGMPMGPAATPAPAAADTAMDVETPAAAPTPAAPPPMRSAETPAAAAPAVPAVAPTAAFNEDTLRNIMAGVGNVLRAQQDSVNLTDVLGREQLDPLLGDDAFTAALLPLLPEGEQTLAGLRENISSPQFKEALASFTAVLSSEDAAVMMGQFGVDPAVVAQNGGGAAGLLAAIQAKADAEPKPMEESNDA